VITNLVQIKRLGEKKREENGRFRKYMKSRVFVERQFRKAAEEVHDQIDCRLKNMTRKFQDRLRGNSMA